MEDESFQDDTIRQPFLNLASDESSTVTPLEQEVLNEYTRLLNNMNELSATLNTLSSGPITLEIAEGIRVLERRIASVFTLMKASVYSIVLQQGQMDGEDQTRMGGDETMMSRAVDESRYGS